MFKLRSLRWLFLLLLVLASTLGSARDSSAGRCGSYVEGKWSGICSGAAADCGILIVCLPPPV